MSKTTYCEGQILFTSKKETTIHSFTESTNFRAGGTQSQTAQTTNHQSYDHSEIQRTTEKANVLILRGKRRKGKDVHGNPHLDLMSNDYTENEAGFNKLYEEIFCENITNGDTNAVWSYKVRISEIKTTKYPWLPQSEIAHIKIDFIYYDHFGLDYPDLEKKRAPSPYIAWDHNVFYEWFILQHFRGFKPFLTKVKNSYEISIIK